MSLKAQGFAVDKGSEIEVTGYETVEDGFGKFPEAILNFKLIIQPNIFKVFMKSLYQQPVNHLCQYFDLKLYASMLCFLLVLSLSITDKDTI